MSKLAVILAVLGIGGLGGLTAWNMALQGELDQLRDRPSQAVVGLASAPARAESPRAGRQELQKFRVLEERLDTLEVARAQPAASTSDTAVRAAMGQLPELSEEALKDLPEALRSDHFRRAVYGLLDARDTERRRERMEKEATRMTARSLRDLEVSDVQRSDFSRMALDYLVRRDELRRNVHLDDESKRAQTKLLSDELAASQRGVLGDDLFAQLEERRDKMRRRKFEPRRTRRAARDDGPGNAKRRRQAGRKQGGESPRE